MSLNKSKPTPVQKPSNQTVVTQQRENQVSPDYVSLVRFLVEPLLESAESLRVDCEKSPSKPKVWIRIAFEDPEKGRVFGRGGRNIQAIRTVLAAAAQTVGESIYLDIYGHGTSDRSSPDRSSSDRSSHRRSPNSPAPRPKLSKPSERGNSR
jgi:hypothetical protein